VCGSSLTHKASESRFNKVKSTKGTALGFKDIALAVMNRGTWNNSHVRKISRLRQLKIIFKAVAFVFKASQDLLAENSRHKCKWLKCNFSACCHSIFALSLARSFFSGPHGMSLTHAACDQPLMNLPITKLKFCHSIFALSLTRFAFRNPNGIS